MSRICMLVTNSVRKDPRVQKEALSAYNAGHEVTVIGIKDQNYDPLFLDSVPYDIVLIENIVNRHKRYSPLWFLAGVIKANHYNNEFKRIGCSFKPDLVHSNDYDTLKAGYSISKKCNAKLVYDSHEVATGSILADNYLPVKKYIEFNERKIIRKAYKVISVSNAAADYLADLYNIQRPTVITNCPNYYSLNNDDSNTFEVLYQGIMSYGRGYEELIEAVKLFDPSISLVIRGYGEIKDELIDLAKREGVQNRVYFAKPVEINQLIEAASHSSVGVVLTRPVCINYSLTVSNKLFEYIQAELPLILSNVPEHVYLNNKYKIGIVIDDLEPNTIASAVNRLNNNAQLYEELKNNVKLAKESLSWESFEKKLLDIYSNS